MPRLASDPVPDRQDSVVWNGTEQRAREITEWARNGDGVTRFQAPRPGAVARVLVERDFPDSAEWVACPAGSVIYRSSTANDARLTVDDSTSWDRLAQLQPPAAQAVDTRYPGERS